MKDNNSNFIERRKHPRFNFRYFTTIHIGNETLYASVKDITEAGVGIVLTKKLPINKVIDLSIGCIIGGEDKAEIHMKAKVVWSESMGKDKIFRAGLKIIEVSKDDIDNFRRIIQDLKECPEENK